MRPLRICGVGGAGSSVTPHIRTERECVGHPSEKEVSSMSMVPEIFLWQTRREAIVSRKYFRLITMIGILLGASAFLQGQTTVNVTAGTFMELDGPFGAQDTFAFQIATPGTSTSAPVVYSGGIADGNPTGFYSCTFGCTVSTIIQIGKSIPLYLAPNFILYGVPGATYYCGSGGGSFNYSSGFSYSIKSGVLTAQGTVTPNMAFTPNDFTTCNSIGLPTYVITGQWKFAAQFSRMNGLWYLTQLEFHPVP